MNVLIELVGSMDLINYYDDKEVMLYNKYSMSKCIQGKKGEYFMALLHPESFERIEKHRNTVHKQATATFTVFDDNGHKYFQIDTYGTNERLMPEKVSQSIQIDKEMAKKLIDILSCEFYIK